MLLRIVPSMTCVFMTSLLCGCGGRPANPPPPAIVVAPADGGAAGVVDGDPVPPGDGPPRPRFDGPAFKSFQELVAGLPKDKQPKPGPEAIIERNDAKAWFAEHIAGKTVEFALHVRGIDIQDAGEGRYNLDLLIAVDPKSEENKRVAEGVKVDMIKIGNVPCQVHVRGPTPLWTNLDSITARKYRDLKNKHVVFQAVLDEADFQDSERANELIFRILIADPIPVSDAAAPADAPKKEPPAEKKNQ